LNFPGVEGPHGVGLGGLFLFSHKRFSKQLSEKSLTINQFILNNSLIQL
jgi:hypothetical protein